MRRHGGDRGDDDKTDTFACDSFQNQIKTHNLVRRDEPRRLAGRQACLPGMNVMLRFALAWRAAHLACDCSLSLASLVPRLLLVVSLNRTPLMARVTYGTVAF